MLRRINPSRMENEFFFAAICFISAAMLIFFRLGNASLWLDDSHTWWFAHLPLGNSLDAIREVGVHPPLYFLGEKLFTAFLGESEFSLRLFSALLGLVGVALAMLIGREVAGRTGMVAAGWFWAFHPMVLWYAREARPYAALAVIAAFSVAAFLAVLKRPSRKYWIWAGISLSLGLLTHYFFLLVYGVLILFALIEMRTNPIFFRKWVLLSIAAIIPLIGWLIWYSQLESPALAIGWIEVPKIRDIPLTLWNLVSGYGGSNTLPDILFGIVSGTMMLIGLSENTRPSWSRRAFIFGTFLPIIAIWLISHRRPAYVDRYFISQLPFVTIMVAVGAGRIWDFFSQIFSRRSIIVIRTGVWISLLMVGLYSGFEIHLDHKFDNEDWRGLAAALEENSTLSPSLWFLHDEMVVPLKYYYSGEFRVIRSAQPPLCSEPCWWVLRQPFTATHAYAQSISQPYRTWKPELPDACHLIDSWESDTQLALWQIQCAE